MRMEAVARAAFGLGGPVALSAIGGVMTLRGRVSRTMRLLKCGLRGRALAMSTAFFNECGILVSGGCFNV